MNERACVRACVRAGSPVVAASHFVTTGMDGEKGADKERGQICCTVSVLLCISPFDRHSSI